MSNVVCAFTKFELLEDRSKSCLVKIGFEAIKLRATKAISFAYVHQIEQSKKQ